MRDIFEISKSGLFAAQQSLATVSNNIANANTPGYTRQRADLSAEVLRKSGFTLGRGVNVDRVERLRNELTDRQIRFKEHELGDLNERSRIYQQMEAVLITSTGDDLDMAVSDFFSSFSELSNNPQDINLRNVVVSKATTMAEKFRNTSSDLEDISRQVFNSAQSRVDKLNALIQNLADVNADIAKAEATSQPDLTSKDQQELLLKDLSELVSIDTSYRQDGTVEARIGGIVVLNGTEASSISAESGPGSHDFRLRLDNGKLLDPGKGALAADMHMFSQAIPDMSRQLDKIAASIVGRVNNIHSGGYGLDDAVSRTFFDPAGQTAGTLSLNSAIVNNPNHIAASSVAGEAGNNENSAAIGNLRNLPLLDGQTIGTNIIQMISRPGLKLNELEKNIASKESAQQLLINQKESVSGVNIDEELSDLIKFQNAYQASARVLNAGQQMYDTLLSIL